MLEEQHNSVIQSKKKEVSFETIKDNTLDNEPEEKVIETPVTEVENPKDDFKKFNLDIDLSKEYEDEEPKEKIDDSFFFKNKMDIEKELFDEFNKTDTPIVKEEPKEDKDDLFGIAQIDRKKIEEEKEEIKSDNKFPDMSIDEYMKNFNENDVSNVEDLFGEDAFPTIPM